MYVCMYNIYIWGYHEIVIYIYGDIINHKIVYNYCWDCWRPYLQKPWSKTLSLKRDRWDFGHRSRTAMELQHEGQLTAVSSDLEGAARDEQGVEPGSSSETG